MAYEYDSLTGDYGPEFTWADSTGTVKQNGDNIVSTSLTATAAPSQGQDQWSGWLQSLIGQVTSYAIAKDARKSGLAPATAANGQPIYASSGAQTYAPAGLNISRGTLWLIGGAAIVGLGLYAASKG